jgi:hypothetical protein
MSLSELAYHRQQLLNQAYNGHLDIDRWLDLANRYRFNGYDFNADWCIKKLTQFLYV